MTALGPTKRSTTADQVEASLFDAIMDRRLPPGSPLRLQELATDLGVSMMPVREALRRLEALALIEIQPHRGAWVRPLTRDDLRDTYFTRLHLETLAVRHGAGRFTTSRASDAAGALQDHEAARDTGDHIAARDAHERFHFLLYEASGSQWLMWSIRPAWRNSERYRVESMRHPDRVAARGRERAGVASCG